VVNVIFGYKIAAVRADMRVTVYDQDVIKIGFDRFKIDRMSSR